MSVGATCAATSMAWLSEAELPIIPNRCFMASISESFHRYTVFPSKVAAEQSVTMTST